MKKLTQKQIQCPVSTVGLRSVDAD